MTGMYSSMCMHNHIYSWKLSPSLVLLAKVCPWLQLKMIMGGERIDNVGMKLIEIEVSDDGGWHRKWKYLCLSCHSIIG